jgi:hypothetical protein
MRPSQNFAAPTLAFVCLVAGAIRNRAQCVLNGRLSSYAFLARIAAATMLVGFANPVFAQTTYTYTQSSSNDIVPSFQFTTSLTGASLNNLPPGTNISATVTTFVFQPRHVPQTDNAGFPIGGSFGSGYFNATKPSILIGTNGSGQITSWTITEPVFASYPAFAGENPNDFFCRYNAITQNIGDSLILTQDNDAGFCPAGTTTSAGSFGAPSASHVAHDFDHNNVSDVLLLTTANGVGMWLMNSSAAVASALNVGTLPSGWSIVGQRDFNGGGFADLLLRFTDGSVGLWLMNGATIGAALGLGNPGTSWVVMGTGDFNNDGIGDILWYHSSGAVAIWYMNNLGQLAAAVGIGSLPIQWTIAGTGDFDGDGVWDILWHHSSGAIAVWLMNSNGTIKSAVGLPTLPPATWTIAGTGDFDGNGISDILLNASGSLAIWFMNSSGGIASAQGAGTLPAGWAIAETGDFNGNTTSDMLLYHAASGTVAAWLMNGAAIASVVSIGTLPPPTWSIVTSNAD